MDFFANEEYVVEIDPENKVTMRLLSHGQRKVAMSRSCKVDARTGEIKLDYALLMLEYLKAAVVSWDGPGFGDKEVNAENIDGLSGLVGQKLEQGLQENDTLPSEDEDEEN